MALFNRGAPDENDEPQPLDPVAVTLAIWLGLIVGVTGLVRLSANAAQASAARQAANPATSSYRTLPARAFAFGG